MFHEQLIIIFRVISEGSYGSEDWSIDTQNTALITGINYIEIENSY